MGCGQSKDAVKAIQIQDGEVRSKSAKSKKIKVSSSDQIVANEENAIQVGGPKATSAKSRDSGIEEMDFSSTDDIITEDSNPHLIKDVENHQRPSTPNFELVGAQFNPKSAGRERMRSKAILQELEAEGLITGTKVQKGGAAFEVNVGPLQPLEPLAPIRRPPPRLERLKSEKTTLTKEDLEKKMNDVEERRKKTIEKKKSRLASQLAKDQDMARRMHKNHEHDSADNADHITWKPGESAPDNGQGERIQQNKASVFDASSLESLEDDRSTLPAGNSALSRNDSPSRASVNA